MTEVEMREIKQALLADEGWRATAYDSLRYLIGEQLIAEYLVFFDKTIDSVRFWVKAPGDVQEILARAAEDYADHWGLSVFEVMDICARHIWEEIANQVNEGSCRLLQAQGLHGESILPAEMPGWPSKRADYDSLIAHVRFWWDQMRHPDSIFDSPSSCRIDLTGQIESMGRDPAEMFAEYTAPFFGQELGRLLYRWGEELDRLTLTLRHGRKKERIRQTEELTAALESKKGEFVRSVRETLTEETLAGILEGILT